MSQRSSVGQIALLTTGVIVTGFLGYAVYFDYQRRNSASFRKGIQAQHKKIAEAAEAKKREQNERNSKALKEVLVEIQGETPIVSPEQQEAYFQEQVAEGEAYAVKGPEYQVKAASHFYRALRVYPNPIELLRIYEKVVPPPVFQLLIELTKMTGGEEPKQRAPTIEEVLAMMQPELRGSSIEDLDDSSPPSSTSPKADSATSGTSGDWVDAA